MIAPGIPLTFVGLEWQLCLEAERRRPPAQPSARAGSRAAYRRHLLRVALAQLPDVEARG
jgi:hypothetical protein